jgi:hypothetical protein
VEVLPKYPSDWPYRLVDPAGGNAASTTAARQPLLHPFAQILTQSTTPRHHDQLDSAHPHNAE